MDFLINILSRICQEETVIMLFPSTGNSIENQLVAFPEMKERLEQAAESKCCQALRKIYDILNDKQLEDVDCFHKIEAIIFEMGEIGLTVSRHD